MHLPRRTCSVLTQTFRRPVGPLIATSMKSEPMKDRLPGAPRWDAAPGETQNNTERAAINGAKKAALDIMISHLAFVPEFILTN